MGGLPAGTIQLVVEQLVYQGDGLGRHQGRAVFVPFSAPGDTLLCRVTEEKKRFLRGIIEKVVIPSPSRVEPRCPHFTRCGGCQWQHVEYRAQLEAKEGIFRSILERNAGVSSSVVGEIIPAPQVWGYRSRCLLRCSSGPEEGAIGFYGRKSHQVVGLTECPALHPELERVRALLSSTLRDEGRVTLFSEIHLEVGDQGSVRAVLVPGVVTRRDEGVALLEKALPALEEMAREYGITLLLENFSGELQALHDAGEPEILPLADSLSLRFWPKGFFQVNLEQNRRLNSLVMKLAKDLLKDPASARVLDLYCGMGNLSLPLAAACREVVGVELSPSAVEMAWKNATANGLGNVRFIRDSAENFLKFTGNGEFDLVVVDPPRVGAKKEAPMVAELRPGVIIYVSCDPMTLARDLRELVAVGYRVACSVPLDMFPHTFHIESVTALVLD